MRIYIYTFIPMAAQSEYIFEYNLRKKETNDNTVVV